MIVELQHFAQFSIRRGTVEHVFVGYFAMEYRTMAQQAFRQFAYQCDDCDAPFLRKSDLTKHRKNYHAPVRTHGGTPSDRNPDKKRGAL